MHAQKSILHLKKDLSATRSTTLRPRGVLVPTEVRVGGENEEDSTLYTMTWQRQNSETANAFLP